MENFKKLNSAEKKSLLKEIYDRNLVLHFKFENSQVYKAKLVRAKKSSALSVRRPSQLSIRFHQKLATVIIAIEQERYFLVSSASLDLQSVNFGTESAIYHLQRRKLRRMPVPGVYPASLMIKKIGGNLSFLKAVIIDISDLGLRVGLNSEVPLIKVGLEVIGTLRLGTRRGIEIKARVRHLTHHSRSSLKQIFGLEIIEMSDYSQSLYKNQLLELQRDIFTIFLGKN